MISLYTKRESGIEVPVDTLITFDELVIKTCNMNLNSVPTSTITLDKSGIYRVHFDCVVANNSSSSGVVSIQLYNNGVLIPTGFASGTSTGSSDIINLNLDTVIRVRPSCSAISNIANLQFRVVDTDSLIFFANAYVERIA